MITTTTGVLITIASIGVTTVVTDELSDIFKNNPIIKLVKIAEISAMGAIAISLTVSTVKLIKNCIGG